MLELPQNVPFLAIDPSSAHLAYALAEIDNKELYIHHAGMLWTKPNWSKGKKLIYMHYAFEYLINGIVPVPAQVFTEAYFMNPKLRMGVAVVPTINHLLEMRCTHPTLVPMQEVPPPSWRRVLGIKPSYANGKRDYKQPTREAVEAYMKVPETILSNITGKARATPHDMTDALAIAIAVGEENGIDKVTSGNVCFKNIGLEEHLRKFNELFIFEEDQ